VRAWATGGGILRVLFWDGKEGKVSDEPKIGDLELTYAQATSGYDEPEAMWMNGRTLKDLAVKEGHPILVDSDGNPILDGECYVLTPKGVYLVEP
jgi:hypothetical protein